jgi:hypothetical protein
VAWWRIEIQKMGGIGESFEKGRCLLCYEQEDDKHILLTCPETMK